MRRPDFPLAEAVAWFLEDARSEIQETTWLAYRSILNAFVRWLPESSRTLASVEPETVERFVRGTAENVNTRRNKIIGLKSLARHRVRR